MKAEWRRLVDTKSAYRIPSRPALESGAQVALTCLELFAGPGGLALGSHLAGFQHAGLIELEAAAASTLRANSSICLHLETDRVIESDARDIDYTPYVGTVDLLTAGPPCQPFSTGGHGKGADDPRNMFPTLLEAVGTIMPKAILIENVKGLTRDKFQNYFSYVLQRLRYPLHSALHDETWAAHRERLLTIAETEYGDSEQYVVWHQVVDAADYGVPQRRHRVFVVALRRDLGLEPFYLEPTHSKAALLHEQWITGSYWRCHGLPQPKDADGSNRQSAASFGTPLLPTVGALPWRTVRDAIHDLPPPVNRGDLEEFANHMQHPGARTYKGHIGSQLDWPAKALKAGAHGTPGGENMVQVPGGVRYFTIREAARLQTFPDSWKFSGHWGACIRQLGNAVPVDLARQFALAIRYRLAAPSATPERPRQRPSPPLDFNELQAG